MSILSFFKSHEVKIGYIEKAIRRVFIGGAVLVGVYKLVKTIKCNRIPSALPRLYKRSDEKLKMLKGEYYRSSDPLLQLERSQARILVGEFNKNNLPHQADFRRKVLKQLLIYDEKNPPWIEPPIQCDYGYNIKIGKNCFFNYNTVFLDCTDITFGDNVLVAPNVSFFTATHGVDLKSRQEQLQYAKPIKIGNNVWIGGNVVILPGVTIGDNSVIGAGAIVTKNVDANTIVVGNPAKAIKKITS